jgi:hypothetical protein
VTRAASHLGLALGLLAAVAAGAAFAQPTRLGGEFQVNTYTYSQQRYPAVDRDSDGDFVVTWMSAVVDGNAYGVAAQRFNSAGVAQGLNFVVNSYTSGGQGRPKVAVAPAGSFVVIWQSVRDGDGYGIFGQRFDSAGARQAGEFQVNTYTGAAQRIPRVAMDDAGKLVVAWQSNREGAGGYGIFARRFDAAGVAQAAEFQVNTYTPGAQKYPSVGIDTDGDFVVTWDSDGQDGASYGVFARRFNSAGAPQATELQINTYVTGDQERSAVALDGDGDFVVAWNSAQDGGGNGVFARRFSAAGNALGGEFQVNTYTPAIERNPAIAMRADGQFVVAWEDGILDGDLSGVFGQRFDSAGAASGPQFQINTYVTGSQNGAAIGMDGAGAFVVAWESRFQDGYQYGVFAQRFAAPLATIDVDGNGKVEPLTDTLLMLRYVFGFRGGALITGAVGTGCTRCTAPDIEAYIDSLD